jgi:hypothetical protein
MEHLNGFDWREQMALSNFPVETADVILAGCHRSDFRINGTKKDETP